MTAETKPPFDPEAEARRAAGEMARRGVDWSEALDEPGEGDDPMLAAIRRAFEAGAAAERERAAPRNGVSLRLGLLAAEWDHRAHGRSGAGKRSTYRICAREVRLLAGMALDDEMRALPLSETR